MIFGKIAKFYVGNMAQVTFYMGYMGSRLRPWRDELDGAFCLKMEPEEYWYKGKFIQGIFIEGECRERLYGKTVYEGKYKNGKRHGNGRLIKFRLHLGRFS